MFKLLFFAIALVFIVPPLMKGTFQRDLNENLEAFTEDMPSVSASLARAESFLSQPDQWWPALTSLWDGTEYYAQQLSTDAFQNVFSPDPYAHPKAPYAGNADFFGGYSAAEMYRLYEDAYPNYHQTMRTNQKFSHNWGMDDYSGFGGLGGGGGQWNGRIGGLQNFSLGNIDRPSQQQLFRFD